MKEAFSSVNKLANQQDELNDEETARLQVCLPRLATEACVACEWASTLRVITGVHLCTPNEKVANRNVLGF
jgi:hypothetical protein